MEHYSGFTSPAWCSLIVSLYNYALVTLVLFLMQQSQLVTTEFFRNLLNVALMSFQPFYMSR